MIDPREACIQALGYLSGASIMPLDVLKRTLVEAAKPPECPLAGTEMLCLICAHEKPWGVWNPAGVAVCRDCRDKVRASSVELTDDFVSDEPLAFLVPSQMPGDWGGDEEYRVFANEGEAANFADQMADEHGRDWLVYPMYASHPAVRTEPAA